MSEQFNVDLPPPFHYREGDEEEKEKQLEEYLEALSRAIDEMMRRLFNRLV